MSLLKHYEFGSPDKPTVIILHGLLGSARNWGSMAKELSAFFHVFTLDLRNHGSSFHHSEMNYPVLADDLKAWLTTHNAHNVHLIGHSLGGKVAMKFAQDYPEYLNSLAVIDIAPKQYGPHHTNEFTGMQAISLDQISSRKEADQILENFVQDWAMRQFLLTNLERENDQFRWKVNLPVLVEATESLSQNSITKDKPIDLPTLFVRGECSDFIQDGDLERLPLYFGNLRISTLSQSGHNPHIDQAPALLSELSSFINNCQAYEG